MLEFYDSCPYYPAYVRVRLEPAHALSAMGIACLVWGEDALAFKYFVPTQLFALHLVVTEPNMCFATKTITDALPYEIFSGIPEGYAEYEALDPARPRVFPNSVHLRLTTVASEETPQMILLHPQSEFYLDITDTSRSLSLSPFPSSIRFPTRTTFFDSLIATYLDPPNGRLHSNLTSRLRVWFSYLSLYTLRSKPNVLPTGELEPERKELLQSLRPENRPYFEAFARGELRPWRKHAMLRKDILKKLGKHEEASRPLPIPPPGNPALREKLRAQKLAQQK